MSRTHDNDPEKFGAAISNRIDEGIRNRGHFLLSVADNPPYTYSIGLAEKSMPEVIILGLGQMPSYDLLNAFCDRLHTGEVFKVGSLVTQIATVPLKIGAVHMTQRDTHLLLALDRVEREGKDPNELTAVQLIWPDPAGKYPGDEGYDGQFAAQQPLLHLPNMLTPSGRA